MWNNIIYLLCPSLAFTLNRFQLFTLTSKPVVFGHLDVIITTVYRFGSLVIAVNAHHTCLNGRGGGGGRPLNKNPQTNTLKTYFVSDIPITAAQYIQHINSKYNI